MTLLPLSPQSPCPSCTLPLAAPWGHLFLLARQVGSQLIFRHPAVTIRINLRQDGPLRLLKVGREPFLRASSLSAKKVLCEAALSEPFTSGGAPGCPRP